MRDSVEAVVEAMYQTIKRETYGLDVSRSQYTIIVDLSEATNPDSIERTINETVEANVPPVFNRKTERLTGHEETGDNENDIVKITVTEN